MASEKINWVILTVKGAFSARGDTAALAAQRFAKANDVGEVLGIIRRDLVAMPPSITDPIPFIVSIVGGVKPAGQESQPKGTGGGKL